MSGDMESEAKELGWVPKEEWRGDPDKWRPAEEFVERGKTVMPILRKNNERLQGQISELHATVGGLQASLQEAREALDAMREYGEETARKAYDKAVKDLKEQRRAALKEGDTERALEIEDALEQVEEPKPLAKPAAKPATPTGPAAEEHPEYKAWKADNPWTNDKEKAAYAQAMGQYLRSSGDTTVGRAFLDKLTAEVEKRFGQPPTPSRVEGSTGEPRRSGRTYADLPAEAKQACDRFASRLVGPNKAYKDLDSWRKQYAKNYEWE